MDEERVPRYPKGEPRGYGGLRRYPTVIGDPVAQRVAAERARDTAYELQAAQRMLPALNDLADLRRSVVFLSWVLGGVVLIVAVLATAVAKLVWP